METGKSGIRCHRNDERIPCQIFHTNRSATNVYIDFIDDEEDIAGARKLPIAVYEWARQFHNVDFLVRASRPTTDRDIEDSMFAEEFREDWIPYGSH